MKKQLTFLRAISLVTISILLQTNCAPYLSEFGASCPCKDGWKCCSEKCIPEEDECSTDGGTNGECSCMEGWKCCWDTCIPEEAECMAEANRACACRDSRDMVSADLSEFTCYRTDYQCSALALCDDGYDCDQHNRCLCTDLNLCGIDCTTDCICQGETVCDPSTKTCRQPLMCLDDSMCPDDLLCRQTGGFINYYTCQPPDGSEVGGECLRGYDCNSSTCYTNICLQFCTANEDCPIDQFCSLVDHGELGCVVDTDCIESCDGLDEYCGRNGTECLNNYCRVGGDCEGDCGLSIDRPLVGECLPPDILEPVFCADNEFVSTPSMAGYCMIYQACWSDADCQEPYRCILGNDLDVPPPVSTGLCARSKL